MTEEKIICFPMYIDVKILNQRRVFNANFEIIQCKGRLQVNLRKKYFVFLLKRRSKRAFVNKDVSGSNKDVF